MLGDISQRMNEALAIERRIQTPDQGVTLFKADSSSGLRAYRSKNLVNQLAQRLERFRMNNSFGSAAGFATTRHGRPVERLIHLLVRVFRTAGIDVGLDRPYRLLREHAFIGGHREATLPILLPMKRGGLEELI